MFDHQKKYFIFLCILYSLCILYYVYIMQSVYIVSDASFQATKTCAINKNFRGFKEQYPSLR